MQFLYSIFDGQEFNRCKKPVQILLNLDVRLQQYLKAGPYPMPPRAFIRIMYVARSLESKAPTPSAQGTLKNPHSIQGFFRNMVGTRGEFTLHTVGGCHKSGTGLCFLAG